MSPALSALKLIKLTGSQPTCARHNPSLSAKKKRVSLRALMASALLASGNEPCWGEAKVYIRKNPISNPNPRPYPNLCSGDHTDYQEMRFRTAELEETPPAATTVVSEEESSFNRKRDGAHNRRDPTDVSAGAYVTFDTSTYSRRELRELKRRLISELDQVRSLMGRIQARDFSTSARSVGFSASGVYGGSREVNSPAAFQSVDPYAVRPSDLLVNANKVSGSRRASLVSPREPKRLALAPAPDSEKLLSAMMKKCAQILSKLMKHKKCIWFNSPVDVTGMGLHDYFQIVKTPMDLGTVKAKLNKGLYLSPEEFASDVRLTFKNALLYNPEGHEVHKLANHFLRHFEVLFGPANHKFENQRAFMEEPDAEAGAEVRPRVLAESALKHGIPSSLPASPQPPPLNQETQQMPRPEAHQRFPSAARAPGLVKLPKPKAKEPNKRPMSLEEKQKLSEGLQSLPQEKMSNLLSIVKKRNPDVMQNGDEIELDIDSMDIETLWELDRFLSNCKKMMSKMRRQEAFAASGLLPSSHAAVEATPEPVPAVGGEMYPMLVDESEDVAAARKSKKGGDLIAEEDVDIGDELPGTNYPSVEIQKDAGCASSSSSSDTDSSSRDSDSGSSSESNSESEGRGEDSPISQRK